MLLAGDVGGTKTLARALSARPRTAHGRRSSANTPRSTSTASTRSSCTFLEETGTRVGSTRSRIGVAGPVTGLVARMTNVPWLADASRVGRAAGRLRRCSCSTTSRRWRSRCRCSSRTSWPCCRRAWRCRRGNAALIAAGTGLGEALLHNVNGRFLPSPSEGGHADFAARTPRELAFVEELARDHGRVDNERVISGPGLVNLFQFTHGTSGRRRARVPARSARTSIRVDLPAAISDAALEGRCEQCVRGARDVRGGLRRRSGQPRAAVGGDGRRLHRRRHRAEDPARARRRRVPRARSATRSRWSTCCGTLPVAVILNPAAGLLGAAVKAMQSRVRFGVRRRGSALTRRARHGRTRAGSTEPHPRTRQVDLPDTARSIAQLAATACDRSRRRLKHSLEVSCDRSSRFSHFGVVLSPVCIGPADRHHQRKSHGDGRRACCPA